MAIFEYNPGMLLFLKLMIHVGFGRRILVAMPKLIYKLLIFDGLTDQVAN